MHVWNSTSCDIAEIDTLTGSCVPEEVYFGEYFALAVPLAAGDLQTASDLTTQGETTGVTLLYAQNQFSALAPQRNYELAFDFYGPGWENGLGYAAPVLNYPCRVSLQSSAPHGVFCELTTPSTTTSASSDGSWPSSVRGSVVVRGLAASELVRGFTVQIELPRLRLANASAPLECAVYFRLLDVTVGGNCNAVTLAYADAHLFATTPVRYTSTPGIGLTLTKSVTAFTQQFWLHLFGLTDSFPSTDTLVLEIPAGSGLGAVAAVATQ